jgi:hypothetical protein
MFPSLHYLDRYRNEGTRTYSKHSNYSEAEPKYQPTSVEPSFSLKSFWVPLEELLIYTATPPKEIKDFYLTNDHALFCVHPQVLENFSDDPYIKLIQQIGRPAKNLTVTPSSSTRTLYTDDPASHALKLHFPFRVSRYGRKMRHEVIEQAINVSRDLEQGIDNFDDKFGYLREVIGISHQNLEPDSDRAENWGYLIRDMQPYPQVDEPRTLIPGFALYGKDFFESTKPPLLYDLISDKDPLEFILQDILFPIIRHWIQCYKAFGYLLEPHGQNVLFEVDTKNKIKRIIHRDLSLGIDMRRREDLGLSSDNLNNYNRMNYGEFNSITYDMFMGNHFFDRIVACCREKYPDLAEEDFRAPCRKLFADLFPEHTEYFPKTVKYFSEERDRFNKPLYLDTGVKPIWRP